MNANSSAPNSIDILSGMEGIFLLKNASCVSFMFETIC